jgi:hypothetical protein
MSCHDRRAQRIKHASVDADVVHTLDDRQHLNAGQQDQVKSAVGIGALPCRL